MIKERWGVKSKPVGTAARGLEWCIRVVHLSVGVRSLSEEAIRSRSGKKKNRKGLSTSGPMICRI